jgi:prepilin signal peptidase PulO-like enzyme (type II secretory pathway)
MVIACCIIGALLVSVMSYICIITIGNHRKLEISTKNTIIYEITTFIATLIIGYLSFDDIGMSEMILLYLLICMTSIVAYIDAKFHFISNRLLLLFIVLWIGVVGIVIIMETEYGLAMFFQSLIGAIAGGLIFLLCYVLSRGQLGAGDVKLVFVMGLYLTGERIISAILYGVVLCFVYSLIQLIRKEIGIKDGVPLAPFLYVGTLISCLLFS